MVFEKIASLPHALMTIMTMTTIMIMMVEEKGAAETRVQGDYMMQPSTRDHARSTPCKINIQHLAEPC